MLANHCMSNLKANKYPEHAEDEILLRGQRLLYLAAATLERETGTDRMTLGGEDLMPERLIPFMNA